MSRPQSHQKNKNTTATRNYSESTSETRENFCPPCLAVPVAIAGAGAMGVGGGTVSESTKQWIFWIGIILTVISIGVIIYFRNRGCSTCQASSG